MTQYIGMKIPYVCGFRVGYVKVLSKTIDDKYNVVFGYDPVGDLPDIETINKDRLKYLMDQSMGYYAEDFRKRVKILEEKEKAGAYAFKQELINVSFLDMNSDLLVDRLVMIRKTPFENITDEVIASYRDLSNMYTIIDKYDDRFMYYSCKNSMLKYTTETIENILATQEGHKAFYIEQIESAIENLLHSLKKHEEEINQKKEYYELDGFIDNKKKLVGERIANILNTVEYYSIPTLGLKCEMARKDFVKFMIDKGFKPYKAEEYRPRAGDYKTVYYFVDNTDYLIKITKTEKEYADFLLSMKK